MDELLKYLHEFFQGDMDTVRLWMKTPNPLLGNVAPDDMILAGRKEKLLQFVKVQIEENTPL